MNDIITKVKTISWIIDTEFDDYLNTVVPMLLEYAEKYCNQEWRDDNGNPEDVPGPVIMFVAKATEYSIAQAGVKSETLGDYSISIADDIPASALAHLKQYRKVKFI